MDNREGTIVSIITYTNNRFTSYAKKVCIDLTNSIYACLICRSFLSIVCIRNCISFHLKKYHDTSQIVITLSLSPIALYVSMIQHSICLVYYLKVFFESSISMDFVSIT